MKALTRKDFEMEGWDGAAECSEHVVNDLIDDALEGINKGQEEFYATTGDTFVFISNYEDEGDIPTLYVCKIVRHGHLWPIGKEIEKK